MRKTISILFALALVLSFSLVATTPVSAVTAVPPGTGTIQAAVLASTANDILQLTPGGLYIESQITIPHNLTIMGGSPKPVINPNSNLQTDNAAGAWFLINPGVTFSMSNVVLDGSTLWVRQALRNHGLTTIDKVDFLNIQGSASGSPYRGMGIQSYGGLVVGGGGSDSHGVGGMPASTLTVMDCTFQQMGRIGVLVKGDASTAVISGCTYTGKGLGDWLDYFVDLGGGGIATITDNTATGCTGVASSDGSASAGILVSDYWGPGTQGTITCNTLTGNTYGIHVGYLTTDQSVVTANLNNIYGNTTYGVRSRTTVVTTDATLNWWGDDSGPYHSTNTGGLGDPVSDNVDFTPWIKKSAETVTGTGTASFVPSHGAIVDLVAVAAPSLPSVNFPHGMFNFKITGLTPGQTVDVTITLPSAVPVGTVWWKYDNGRWHSLPNLDDNGNNIMKIRLTDGGTGDLDNVPGQITDPGGAGNPMTVGWEGSPTSKAAVVMPWIALLAAIVAGAGLFVWKRRRVEI